MVSNPKRRRLFRHARPTAPNPEAAPGNAGRPARATPESGLGFAKNINFLLSIGAGTTSIAACSLSMAGFNPVVVLLVDDEPMLRMLAREGLEDAGFEVVEADDAEAALEILGARADVTVLFTDVNMPGPLDGLALARRVHEQWPAIQLVLTSGRGLAAPLPDDGRFMPKPYSIVELISAVGEAAREGH
jgi:CheY-like chemotaxis protein